jgi:amidase/aspartyl-tRNA(Asn)/glutamyl-tRNA(Gln) amidotransferase subunit A
MTARDLVGLRAEIAAGRETAVGLIERSIERPARRAVRAPSCCRLSTLPATPRAGPTRYGERTGTPRRSAVSPFDQGPFRRRRRSHRAGSKVLADDAPAARLSGRGATARRGAALIGRTNMSEFAFSGVGINPHHGTPVNAARGARLDGRAPGGSTSGGATSVAAGGAWAALGSDTGGSIRIPRVCKGRRLQEHRAIDPAEGRSRCRRRSTPSRPSRARSATRYCCTRPGCRHGRLPRRPLTPCRFLVPQR